MKKIFSVLVALTMLFALCVPAFAGTAVDALMDSDAYAFANSVVTQLTAQPSLDLKQETTMQTVSAEAAAKMTIANLKDPARRAEIAKAATTALAQDYTLEETQQAAFEKIALNAMTKVYDDSNLGVSTFDPSDVVDNIADGFTDNDLAGLFDTLRNTITDLSDRLSGVFEGIGGNGGTSGGTNSGSTNDNGADNTFGGSEPTGDVAIYAVAGVAAVAAVALVLTKKKSK